MDAAISEARRALADMVKDALREREHDAVAIEIRDGADGPVVIAVNLTTLTPDDAS